MKEQEQRADLMKDLELRIKILENDLDNELIHKDIANAQILEVKRIIVYMQQQKNKDRNKEYMEQQTDHRKIKDFQNALKWTRKQFTNQGVKISVSRDLCIDCSSLGFLEASFDLFLN